MKPDCAAQKAQMLISNAARGAIVFSSFCPSKVPFGLLRSGGAKTRDTSFFAALFQPLFHFGAPLMI